MSDTVFIEAMCGGIGVYIGAGNLVGTAKTARELHKVINRNKIDLHMRDIFFCSGMDFATEAGFADDGDARTIFFDMQAMWLKDLKWYFDKLAKN